MISIELILYLTQLLLAAITAGGFAYLVYSRRFAIGCRAFFNTIIVGLSLFVISGLVVGYMLPSWRHAAHMVGTLGITGGLYELVKTDIADPDQGFLLLDEE